jgi:hypothetical protein
MKFFSLPAIALGAALALGACGSDDEDPKTSEHVQPAECKPISSACHDADHDSDPQAHECHEKAHGEWTAEECTANAVSCISLCESLQSDGGGGQAGGSAGHAGAAGDGH